MEFKAFSFEQNSHTYAEVKRAAADCINDTAIYFESYSDSKQLFSDIAEALELTDVLLIGIEPKAYLKFKPFLIKAFKFTPAYSDRIMDAIEGAISDETFKKAHALVPNEAEELLTEDGLYSGFYVNEDNQYIIVFPLIENVAPAMLRRSGLPFFKGDENKKEVISSIASEQEASPKASTIVEKLLKNDFKISIPSTPAAKLLKADIKACDEYMDFVFFTPFVNDTGIDDPKQYAAQLAKGAMELRNTQLGATISNIFREKKGDKVISYYAYISVATADKVVVKKLFADSDENIDNLVAEATAELYAMIDKYIDEIAFKLNASPEDKAKYESSVMMAEAVSDVRPEATISKAGILVAVVAIVLAIIACVFVALKLSDFFVKPDEVLGNSELQAGAPAQTQGIVPNIPANTLPPNTVGGNVTAPTPTSVFEITTTLPIPDTTYDIIYQNPNHNQNQNQNPNPNNNNTPSQTEANSTPSTTEPVSTTEGDAVEW